jgi:hypothetical protein
MNQDPSDRDWHTSVEEEGGAYSCKCYRCGNPFYGYKRQVICRLCDSTQKLPEPKPELTDSQLLDWLFENIHLEYHTTDGQLMYLNTRGKIIEALENRAGQPPN